MLLPGLGYLSVGLLGAVVVAAVIVDHHVSILVVEAGGRDQLPAAAVVRKLEPGGTQTRQTQTREVGGREGGAGGSEQQSGAVS